MLYYWDLSSIIRTTGKSRSKFTCELYITNWSYSKKVGIDFAMYQRIIPKRTSWDGTRLSSYMLKPTYLLTQEFKNNKKAQEKLFKHMCNFGARAEWRNVRRSTSSYLDVDIRNDQYRLVNPTHLDWIKGYISEGAIGDRDLKRLPQLRLNIIDGSI